MASKPMIWCQDPWGTERVVGRLRGLAVGTDLQRELALDKIWPRLDQLLRKP